MDLAHLRLPDPERPPHKEPFPAVVRRAAAACEAEDEEDATRPHALLAGVCTRPAKPTHAMQPPTPPTRAGGPVEFPVDDEAAPAVRRNQYLRKHEAYLSVV
jgi:hypothetical protein